MKRNCLLLLLVFAALSVSAQLQNTRLWRISGNGLTKNSYLYGSMHVDDERVFNFSDSVFYALSSCEVFANEIAADSVLKFVYKSIDKGLQQKIQREYYIEEDESLDEISQRTGLDKRSLKRLSPVVLKELISGLAGPRKRKPAMLDNYLYNIARQEGKFCTGVENLSAQIGLFDQFSEELQKDYTDYTIGKNRVITNKKMIDIYRRANLEETERLFKLLPPDLYKALLSDRNVGMVNSIERISQHQSAFYTVGFAHLPGTDGLISLLKSKGYVVEPVPETFSGLADNFPFKKPGFSWIPFEEKLAGFEMKFPGKAYTSPDMPSGLSHGLYYDLGTNSFYMVAARPAATIGKVNDLDSLTREFVAGAWKQTVDVSKIRKIQHNGMEGRQVDKIQIGNYYLSFRFLMGPDFVFLLMGMNNHEKDLTEITPFFESFRRIEKIAGDWSVFSSETGWYEIRFPGKPKENKIKTGTDVFSPQVHMIAGNDNTSGNEYLVQFFDKIELFSQSDSMVLADFQDGLTSSMEYSDLVSKDMAVEGYPARELSMRINTGQQLRVQMILRGNRVYQIIAAVSGKENSAEQSDAFFQSFRFKPYTYANWQPQMPADSLFSVLSPDTLSILNKTYFPEEFVSSTLYRSGDVMSGDKIRVLRNVYSPFFYSASDSAFFRAYYIQQLLPEDTSFSMVKTGENPLSYDFTLESPENHLISTSRCILKGRVMYGLEVSYPKIQKETHPYTRFFESFTITDSLSGGDITLNKTPALLTALQSDDSANRNEAIRALGYYRFTPDDIPQVWPLLFQKLEDTTLTYTSIKSLLINSLPVEEDSIFKQRLLNAYDSICTDDFTKRDVLCLLIRDYNLQQIAFLKKKLLAIPANSVYQGCVTELLGDSASYGVSFYPEILNLLQDSLNDDEIIVLTEKLLSKGALPVSTIENYKAEIKTYMERVLDNTIRLYSWEQPLPLIFRIAGYFNDAEMNRFLQKHQRNKNKNIVFNIFKSLISNNLDVNKKGINQLAADPDFRRRLYNFLSENEKINLMPVAYTTQAAMAESDLYSYLESEDYTPKSMHQEGLKELMFEDTLCRFYLFRVETEYYDESETFYNISGPYPTDGSIPAGSPSDKGCFYRTSSLLAPEDQFVELETLLNNMKNGNE